MDKAALQCLGRMLALGKGDPSLVVLPPLLLQHHLLGSASAKLQVRTNCREMRYPSGAVWLKYREQYIAGESRTVFNAFIFSPHGT